MSQPRIFGEPAPEGAFVEHRSSAYAIFEHQGRLVLTIDKMAPGVHNLDLAGGGSQDGETPEQTVVREVQEETGWEIKPKCLLFEYEETYKRSLGGKYRHNHGRIYLAEPKRQGLNSEDDHEPIYLDPCQAIANLRHASHKAAIMEWLCMTSKYKLNLAREYAKAHARNPRRGSDAA